MIGLIGIGLIIVGVIVLAWLSSFGRSRGPAVDDEIETLDVPDTPVSRELLGRWRDRSRRWRTIAGLATVLTVLLVGAIVRQEVHLGIGGAPVWSDPLTMGLAAAFLGAIGAELHHLRRRPTGPRTASLEPRSLEEHLPTSGHRRLVILGTAATAMAIIHVVAPGVGVIPIPAAGALATVAAVVLVQRAIVVRPRPHLPPDLAAADDTVRGLAIRSVEAAGAGLMLILLLWQASWTSAAVDLGAGLVSLLAGLVYVGVAIVAITWWWRGGPAALMGRSTGTSGGPG